MNLKSELKPFNQGFNNERNNFNKTRIGKRNIFFCRQEKLQ